MRCLARFTLFAALTGLWACSAIDKQPDADSALVQEPAFPTLSVFLKKPTESLFESCTNFDKESLLHHCQLNPIGLSTITDSVAEKKFFTQVLAADDAQPYRLFISTAVFHQEDAGEIGNAAISGATLFLVPLVQNQLLAAEADLFWHGQHLKHFSYELPIKRKVSLFSLNQDFKGEMAAQIAEALGQDLFANDDMFTAQYLGRAMGASDYQAALALPDVVGPFQRGPSRQFHHPFLGVQYRYLRQSEYQDYADVFVYPIRAATNFASDEAMRAEVDNIKQEIIEVSKKDELSELSFSDVSDFNAESVTRAVSFYADYSDALDNHYRSRVYLAVKGDKFVKIRHTVLESDPVAETLKLFSQQLFAEVSVPDESRFMSRIREEWRQKHAAE